jgi:hypothetical protein
MAGNQNTTQQNIVQFVNPSASASPRPQASQQQGMVYLQLAGGKAIPVFVAVTILQHVQYYQPPET